VIRGDRKLPAGLLRTQPTGAILARIDAALVSDGPPDALAVTVESAGAHRSDSDRSFWQGRFHTREVRMTISSSLEPGAVRIAACEG
jgi:hypothetical protein